MSAQIGFHGGANYNVSEDYETLKALHNSRLQDASMYGIQVPSYEVTLVNGQYGAIDQEIHLLVNPLSVSYIRET